MEELRKCPFCGGEGYYKESKERLERVMNQCLLFEDVQT
jgi:hypothetical protein